MVVAFNIQNFQTPETFAVVALKFKQRSLYELRHKKYGLRGKNSNQVRQNRAVQPQKMVRRLKFWI